MSSLAVETYPSSSKPAPFFTGMTGKSVKPTTTWVSALAYLANFKLSQEELHASVVYRAPTHLAAGKAALEMVVEDMGQALSIVSTDRRDSSSQFLGTHMDHFQLAR